MNLYKIHVLHGAPKNSWTDVYTHIVAESDEDVYQYLRPIAYWEDQEEDNHTFKLYDEKDRVIGTENFKEKMLRIKGSANDEDLDFSDAYYGITEYGWVDMGHIADEEILVLKKFGILGRQGD